MATQLSVKDSQACEAWLEKAKELSNQAYEAMRDTAQIVNEIKNESRGSLADEMVSLSNVVLSNAKVVTETMETVSSAVKKVLEYITSFIDGMTGMVKGITGTLSK